LVEMRDRIAAHERVHIATRRGRRVKGLHGSRGHCGPFRHWPSMRLLAHYGPMAGRDRTCRVDQSHLAPTRRSNARLVPYGSVNDGLTGRAGNARIPRPFSECSTSFPRTSAEHSTKSRARASVGTDANGRSKPRNGWRARPCCPLGRMVTVSGLPSASTRRA